MASAPVVAFARAGIVLDVLILVAAAVYIDSFDFVDHPGGLIYVGLYVGVAALTVWIVLDARRRSA